MSWTWLGAAAAVFLVISCYMGYRRGFIREIVSIFFVLLSMVLVWIVNPYVNQFLRENTPIYGMIQEGCDTLVQNETGEGAALGESRQDNLIENLALPGFLKQGLEENNTAEVYKLLAVQNFGEYVSGYLSTSVMNGVSFMVSFLLSTLLIRMITYALNIIASLPVLHGINKITGGLLGILKGVLFIWIAFLILTVFCNTQFGRAGLALVEKDVFLNALYEQDIFVNIFMSIFYGK